nr:GxxExxY protein [Desulfobulbaceae bacterium]
MKLLQKSKTSSKKVKTINHGQTVKKKNLATKTHKHTRKNAGLELKVVEKIQKIHTAQLLNYLKATDFKVGLLVNFNHPKAEVKRYVL